MVFSDSGKMMQKPKSQIELEDILTKQVINQYNNSELTDEELEQHLNGLDKDLIADSIEKFLDELDLELGNFMVSLDGGILNNYHMLVKSKEKDALIYFDAIKDGKSTPYGPEIMPVRWGTEYLSDRAIKASMEMKNPKNLSTVPSLKWAGIADSIQIKESYNRTRYLDERGEVELNASSRLKRDCARKFTRYIINEEGLGEDGFPRDCGGIRFHTQKFGDLYTVEDIIEREIAEIDFKDDYKDIDYRNLPRIYENHEVREQVGKFRRTAMEYASANKGDPSEDKINLSKMIPGIWMDTSFNGFPIEVQLLPSEVLDVMEFHRITNHDDYKINQKEYQGRDKIIEDFMKKIDEHRHEKLKVVLRERDYSPLIVASHLACIDSLGF